MKKILILSFLSLIFFGAFAQTQYPVKWTFSTVKKSSKEYQVLMTATISQPWHIYSQTTPEGGPVPTSFVFKANPLLTLSDKISEQGKLEQHHEPLFGVDVKFFSNKVIFIQNVTLKTAVKTSLSGTIEFLVCNDKECLPPKKIPVEVKLQ